MRKAKNFAQIAPCGYQEDMELYTKDTIDQLAWPQTPEGEFAKKYLTPLVKNGPDTYIENATTEIAVIKLDDQIIPISINHKEYENTYLVSSYYIVQELKEKLERARSLVRFFCKPLIVMFGAFLRGVKINQVVIINNWLLSTNPYPELTETQLKYLMSGLCKAYPKHYFMFRSINTYKSDQVYKALKSQRFRIMPCRYVYLFDPERSTSPHAMKKRSKDFNRIARRDYEAVMVDSLSESELERVLDLYEQVYIGKYTKFSPRYTPEYLRYHLSNQTMRLQLLKKNDIIYGVNGYLNKDGWQLVNFFGYDLSIPREEGLYRMLSALILKRVGEEGLVAHQGSGAAVFKQWRGSREYLEYVGIYDRHLSWTRRLFWALGERFSSGPKPSHLTDEPHTTVSTHAAH